MMKRLFSLSNGGTKFKVCGLASKNDVAACADIGVDAVGFLLGRRDNDSELDKLTEDEAAELIRSVPRAVASVLLIKATQPEEIIRLVNKIKPSAIQLQHADITTDVLALLRKVLSTEIIKTFRLTSNSNVKEICDYISEAAPYIDAILLDSAKGGSGEVHDWEKSREIAEFSNTLNIPVVFAGGLTPHNVQAAILAVRPFMVDIMSGVSISKGVKDLAKIKSVKQTLSTIN